MARRIPGHPRPHDGRNRSHHRCLDEKLPPAAPFSPNPLPNLPNLNQTIYGRDTEAALLLDELRNPRGRRILPVVAPPFFGKSALLVRLLQQVVQDGRIIEPSLLGIVTINCRVSKDLPGIFRETGLLTGHQAAWEDLARAEQPAERKAQEYWQRLDATGPTWLLFENFEELLHGPDDPALADPAVSVLLDTFLARDAAHRIVVTSRHHPRLPNTPPWPAIERAIADGLRNHHDLEFLRGQGSDCGFDRAPEAALRALAGRVHHMPAALGLAVEFVRESRGEVPPADLASRPELFAEFDRNPGRRFPEPAPRRPRPALPRRPPRDRLDGVPARAAAARRPRGDVV